jgi:peroxin-10
VTAILLPYGLNRLLPAFRARVRAKLESNLKRLTKRKQTASRSFQLQSYILKHLNTITSPSPLHALTLTVFYFTGSYYELSKRVWGVRYIFTKKIGPSEARIGYEVLGVLLVLQIAVQSWIHLHQTLTTVASSPAHGLRPLQGSAAVLEHGVEVSLDDNAYTSNNALLVSETAAGGMAISVEAATHTPAAREPRVQLTDKEAFRWIGSEQQRRCTLCLEELKDPSVAQCGHVFCWGCIGDWVREKPECPLCRRSCAVQHILPLRC